MGYELTEACHWAQHAQELAELTNRYVARRDVWGGYLPLDRRAEKAKTLTRPAKDRRGKDTMTIDVLARHYAATRPEHVIGLHTAGPDNRSRIGTIEIDVHDGEDANDPECTLRAATAWYDRLTSMGLVPSSGWNSTSLSAT